MDEPVPDNPGKMERKVPQTATSDTIYEANDKLFMSDEESSDSNLINFKTPLHPSSAHKSRRAWEQNVFDSGFSSTRRGAFSDRSSSADSSIRSSPESGAPSEGRRVTLGICDFSPVTRATFSVVRSRRLDFQSTDTLPLSSQLQFEDEGVKSQESLSGDLEMMQEKEEFSEDMSLEGTENSPSPVISQSLSFEKDMPSCGAGRASPEDLEISLESMSLEESSSSSLSSRSGSGSTSPSHHLGLTDCASHSQHKQASEGSGLTSSTDDTLSKHSCKANFMSSLHLTSASALSLPSGANCDQRSPNTTPIFPTLKTCHQPQAFLPEQSLDKIQLPAAVASPSKVQSGAYLCKRTGPGELDILSPTKSRKTDSFQEENAPNHTVRNIFQDDQSSNLLQKSEVNDISPNSISLCSHSQSILHPSKNIPSYGKTSFCECSGSEHVQLSFDRLTEPRGKQCSNDQSLPYNLTRIIQSASPLEPSRLIGRNIGVAKLDIVEALHKYFNLCVSKILGFLQDEDLVSVFMVSRTWRLALETDTSSLKRYRCHLRNAAKRKAVLNTGKENSPTKLIDESRVKPMTESKGCLSSLQFQASPRAPQHSSQQPKPSPSCCPTVQWGDELRRCPSCRHQALVRPHQGRAVCMDPSCGYDFCTQCFAAYHHPKPCKPLNRLVSKKDVAGSQISKKSLKRL